MTIILYKSFNDILILLSFSYIYMQCYTNFNNSDLSLKKTDLQYNTEKVPKQNYVYK